MSDAAELIRRGKDRDGRTLSRYDREQLLKPLLPAPRGPSVRLRSPNSNITSPLSSRRRPKTISNELQQRHRVKNFLTLLLHKAVFFLLHLAFSVYIRLRQIYHALLGRIFAILYYHHRTPELIQRDVQNLGKLPRHLSIIVDLNNDDARIRPGPESVSRLIGEVAELAAWCTCVGIPLISVYERTGALKTHIASLHAETRNTFASYFPPNSEPSVQIRAAPDNRSSYSPKAPFIDLDEKTEVSSSAQHKTGHLDILLLSASDGRATLVDLTKTLAEMSQRHKLRAADISPELIHAEIEESSCSEPDLLVVMAGAKGALSTRHRHKRKPKRQNSVDESSDLEIETLQEFAGGGGICLQGYPPWQARLTEIFYMQDNAGVDYQVFLRALYRYAKAEMRFGQ